MEEFEFHQESLPVIKFEQITHSGIFVVFLLVTASGRGVVRVKVVCARSDSDVGVTPHNKVLIISDGSWVTFICFYCWLSFKSEDFLVSERKHVSLTVINVTMGNKRSLRVTRNYLPILHFDQNNDVGHMVHVGVIGNSIFKIMFIKVLGGFYFTACL